MIVILIFIFLYFLFCFGLEIWSNVAEPALQFCFTSQMLGQQDSTQLIVRLGLYTFFFGFT